MRLVGYARVSTDAQAERGLGLEVQEQGLRSWACRRGNRLIAIHRDEGVSGSEGLDGRRGLAAALRDVRKADGLVVYRLDRLARDLIVQEQLLDEVRRSGRETFSVADGENGYLRDDPEDPSRRLIRQVLGAVAEYERAMTRLRLKEGRARKAAEGGFAYGAPPFGYKSVEGSLAPRDDETETVCRMTQLRQQGASLREIVEVLDSESRPPRHGGTWHPETVRRVLAQNGG